MLKRLKHRIRALVRRDVFESDMDQEMRHHLEAYAADLVRAGLSPDAAARRARIEFGAVESLREECREAAGVRWVDEIAQDLRYAGRQLAKSPTYTAAVVLSLALGIGANTAIFGLMDAVLFRAVPVARPEELFFLAHGPEGDVSTASNYPLLERYRAADLFDGVTAYSQTTFTVATADGLERVNGQHVSGNYHSLLGVPIAIGRGFVDEPDRPDGRQPIAVISHDYWTRRFGRDSSVLGRPLSIAGRAITIVGVTGPEFHGLISGNRVHVTLPISMRVLNNPQFLTDRESWISLRQVARLKEGASAAETQRHVSEVFRRYWAEPESQRRPGDVRLGTLMPAGRGSHGLRQQYGTSLYLLFGMVAIVLLVACANVANLAFARGTARAKEIAVRLSLGAGRGRLVRQMLTESTLLAFAGATLGILVATFTTSLILSLFAAGQAPIVIDAALNGRLLLFTAAVAIATSLLVGLPPAFRSTNVDVTPALKDGAQTGRGGRRRSTGRMLVVAQLALSMIVVGVAALLARSVYNLRTFDAGFARAQIVLFDADAGAGAMRPPQQTVFFQALRQRIQAIPGVEAVAFMQRSPIDHSVQTRPFEIPGVPTEGMRGASANVVSPEYFPVLGIRLLRGRLLSETDRGGAEPVAVVDERLAATFFGSTDPLGRRVLLGADKEPYVIVGVVASSRHESLREEPPRTIYTAIAQPPSGDTETERRTVAIRVRPGVNATAMSTVIRREAAAVSREATVSYTRTIEEQLDAALRRERLLAGLSTGYGLLALLLALVGLYGVTSYDVTRRTRDIGIRLAIGATANRVLTAILRQTLATSLAGIAIGVVGAAIATRLVTGFLFGVAPRDPWTLGGVAAVLALTALLAGYIPARRAAAIDPLRALRSD